MLSALYECRVMHHRFAPKRHRFVYGIFLFAIDLDELEALDRSLKFFSVGRANLYSFREDDYFPTHQPLHNSGAAVQAVHTRATNEIPGSEPAVPVVHADWQKISEAPPRPYAPAATLKARVLAYLADHQIDLTGGRVVLLTLPRVFGYLFNPVSFYFCYDRDGTPVATIAEVTNTFREVKPYLLGPATRQIPEHGSVKSDAPFSLRLPKHFYVSPYSSVDVAFDFTLRPPTDRLAIQIDDYAGTERLLTSTLTGHARALSDGSLLSATLRHPLVTLKIIGLIHWHALLLFAKRVPWFRKNAQASDQRDLYRPHPSIASSS